jgi:heat shock protein HslJ
MRRLGIFLVLLAAGCGAPGGSSTPEPVGDPVGTWQLVTGTSNGVDLPVLADHPITLIVEPSSMGGTAACNSYGAEVSLTGGGVQMGMIEQTLRGCEEAVQAAETAYLSALRNVTRIGMDRDHLVLTGPGVELRFQRLSEPPTAALVDVAWTLETLFVGDVATPAAGDPAMLELRSDGTFTGTTGCRTFNGTWIERGNQIHATAMDMNELECSAELADQDSHVVSVIGDGFVPSIEDGLLTLLDPGGVGLVYRSSE